MTSTSDVVSIVPKTRGLVKPHAGNREEAIVARL